MKYDLQNNQGCSQQAKDTRISHINYIFNPSHPGNPKSIGKSFYQERICDKNKSNVTPPKYYHPNIHGSNFQFGNDTPSFNTEMKDK